MGHRHSEEVKNQHQQVLSTSEETNPFLSKNDLTILSMSIPFLSSNGQKIVSFFTNFNRNPVPASDFSGILNLLNNSENSNLIRELLPALLGLAGNFEQGSFDPNILKSLLGIINPNNSSTGKETID